MAPVLKSGYVPVFSILAQVGAQSFHPEESRSQVPHQTHRFSLRCCRVRRVRLIPWMALAITACADAMAGVDPAPPISAASATDPLASAAALVAIHDVITRVLPALESGGSTTAVRSGLSLVATQLSAGGGAGLKRALGEADKALKKFRQNAGPEFHPDVDVIALALVTVNGLP